MTMMDSDFVWLESVLDLERLAAKRVDAGVWHVLVDAHHVLSLATLNFAAESAFLQSLLVLEHSKAGPKSTESA